MEAPRTPRARRSACSRSACTGPSPSSTFVAALPATVKIDRRAGPHQGAGRHRRAAVLRRGHRPGRRLGGRAKRQGHRRALRPGLQGIHAGHGQGASSTSCRRPRPKNHFTVGIKDDVTHTSLDYDPELLHRSPRHGARPVLRPGRGRHRGRQQELHQDHRRGDRQLRPGLLRLRLEEVRRHHHLAPALRPQADPLQLPDRQGQLRGLPPVLLPGTHRRAEGRRARRHLPAEQPLRPGRGLGPPAAHGAAADHRQEAEVLRHRRLRGGQEDRHGRPHQHHHADLLLRHQRRAAARGSHRRHQERHREDLRQARRERREEELRRRGRGPRSSARSEGSRQGHVAVRHPPGRSRGGARVRAEGHRQDHRRRRRRSAGERHAGRRHLPHRHRAVGEAQHRPGNPGVGRGPLHPVRQVRAGLPARRDPRQGLRRQLPGRRAGHLQVRSGPLEGHEGPQVHPAGGARGLHRLHPVRRGLPGQEQERSEAPRHQHGRRSRRCAKPKPPTGTSS